MEEHVRQAPTIPEDIILHIQVFLCIDTPYESPAGMPIVFLEFTVLLPEIQETGCTSFVYKFRD
jgi:hypothetical protein